MPRYLVTGASGFIGGHVVERLVADGHDVRCLLRKSSSRRYLPLERVHWTEGDLNSPESLRAAVADCDGVVHLGGLTSARNERELSLTNGQGTENLARACISQSNPPVFIYMSSIAASGPIGATRPRTEEDPPAPISAYGRSKRCGEITLERLAGQLPTSILRPGIVFGPRNIELLPAFRSICHFHLHAVPGIFPPKLSLIEVSDLVDLTIRCLAQGRRLEPTPESEPRGVGPGIYFATASEFPTYAEFGRLIARATSTSFVVNLPLLPPLPWFAALISESIAQLRGKTTTFNRDKIREASATNWACTSERARRELDFHPAAPLLEQLRESADWYRQAGWL